MSYETRAYDGTEGPVVVMVVSGNHDVSRLVHLLGTGTCEQGELQGRVVRQLRNRNKGRMALKLLRDHGGADFVEEAPV